MEPKTALTLRKFLLLTPYRANAWESKLINAGIFEHFAKIPEGLRKGFLVDFPPINDVQTPPNKDSISEFSTEFDSVIKKEIQKGRLIGPFTESTLRSLIGPFQSSPLSIIPKPANPSKFRIVQNFSFPHATSKQFPNPSVNSSINVEKFPTMWGKFSIVYELIASLPPGSEAATRDVAEAYHTVPLHYSQWPAAVVRISDTHFCVDTCAAFGAAPSAGAYGHIADGGAEIFRAHGISPLDKWVDDHIFFRIRCKFLGEYNQMRSGWHEDIKSFQMQRSGSRLWFKRTAPTDNHPIELNEDCATHLKDLSFNSKRSAHDEAFTYSLSDVDDVSSNLGIIWALQKDQPFKSSTIYIGFLWDLNHMTVSLTPEKVDKYLSAIHKWRKRPAHTLQDVQELYGKLLHACSAVPQGRAYLIHLETMLSTCGPRPFTPHQADKLLAQDLDWWSTLLQSGGVSRSIRARSDIKNYEAFSDASSGIGIAIVIGKQWRAWRLIPGWKTLDGNRDIGWAEAIGFEFLVYALAALPNLGHNANLLVHGDNTGIVEGWWKHRHRNKAVNDVFRRIHRFLHNLPYCMDVNTIYVPSASNPADEPSRGIYGPTSLLLPPIDIPEPIKRFVIDSEDPLSPAELRHLCDRSYTTPAAKFINHLLSQEELIRRLRIMQDEDESVISHSILGY